jgi:DNA-binding CsgD family transcriptional regulator
MSPETLTKTQTTPSEIGFANPDSVWSALAEDTNSPIVVLSAEGVVQYANASFARTLGLPGPVVGKRLNEIIPQASADERFAYLRQVLATGKPVVIDGIIHGQLRRSTMRPLGPDSHGNQRVLSTCRMLSDTDYRDGRATGVVRAKHDDLGQLAALTQREFEILQLIGQGLSTADIAKKLHRSVKTIEWHRVSLGSKLGVTNRVELARIAIHAGIVPLAEETVSAAQPAGTGEHV